MWLKMHQQSFRNKLNIRRKFFKKNPIMNFGEMIMET